jgi:hypothetical protein
VVQDADRVHKVESAACLGGSERWAE